MGGVQTCFNNINWCNMHPQCDSAEDELDCDYKKKRLVPKRASLQCQSRYHNDDSVKANLSRGVVHIRAGLKDGNSECWNGRDEIEIPTEWVSYYLPGLDFLVKQSGRKIYLMLWKCAQKKGSKYGLLSFHPQPPFPSGKKHVYCLPFLFTLPNTRE